MTFCYDLYCHGFGLLDNLGLGYGLNIKVPPSSYNAESWSELTSSEQLKLIDNLYPAVAEEAKKFSTGLMKVKLSLLVMMVNTKV